MRVNWLAWAGKPLWVLAAAQVIPLLVFALPGAGWMQWKEQRQIAELERQLDQQTLAVRHIRQTLGDMPALSTMQTQLAEWAAENIPLPADIPDQWVSTPLSQSGAVLLSLQPARTQAPEPANQAIWRLTFSADYHGVLQVLRQFIALPHVLRVDQLTIKSAEEGLHIEMALMKPLADRRKDVE